MKTLQILKFQIAMLASFFVLCTTVITLQYASGEEPCKMGEYVHYGPSRQSVPCYLVSSPSNPTLEDQFGDPNQTKIAYNDSILILNQTTPKLTYKIGENITVNTELINIGSKTVGIKYCKPLVVFEIKNETGYEIWPNSQLACVPELTGKKTLHPGEHITISPWGESAIPGYVVPTPSMNNSGKYAVISVALFNFNTTYDLTTYHPIALWSKPLQITVLPENYAQSANSISSNTISNLNGGRVTPLQTTNSSGEKLNVHVEKGVDVSGKIMPTGPPPLLDTPSSFPTIIVVVAVVSVIVAGMVVFYNFRSRK